MVVNTLLLWSGAASVELLLLPSRCGAVIMRTSGQDVAQIQILARGDEQMLVHQ